MNQPSLLDTAPNRVYRHAQNRDVLAKVLKLTVENRLSLKIYEALIAGQDTPEVRSIVDRYQSSLLMPKWLIFEEKKQYDFTSWQDLYKLADLAQVTISNLRVRLERLGLIYIPEGSRVIHRSQHNFAGQGELF